MLSVPLSVKGSTWGCSVSFYCYGKDFHKILFRYIYIYIPFYVHSLILDLEVMVYLLCTKHEYNNYMNVPSTGTIGVPSVQPARMMSCSTTVIELCSVKSCLLRLLSLYKHNHKPELHTWYYHSQFDNTSVNSTCQE